MKNIILISTIAVLVTGLFVWTQINPTEPDNTSPENWSGDVYERDYSVSFGPEDAKVTIVEFFDPACEACRAFYPVVKEILARHPEDVRLVLRYAAFHQGSDTVIRMLEIARQQEVFLPVLEALLRDQMAWASHHKPDIDKAWDLAEKAGLNIIEAKNKINSERLDSILKQENEDILALEVRKTPTFFVNQRALNEFGAQQLYDLVVEEINSSN